MRRKWSEHPYQGEQVPPKGNPEPGNWPMFFIYRESDNDFLDPFRQRINWRITNPNQIDWEKELAVVEQTLGSLSPQQIEIAKFWGTGELSEKISTMIFHFSEKYRMGSPVVARVLAYCHSAINDAFVLSWYFKYRWDVARPNQYGKNLTSILFTPRFPAYPSAHATVAGCSDVLLSYFFPQEYSTITDLTEQCAQSRLFAGVHFKADNDEGLRLGRQIGEIVVHLLRVQHIHSSDGFI